MTRITPFAALLLAFMLTACSGSGTRYQREFSDLISRADQIVVIEHSAPSDFEAADKPQERIYARKVLTKDQHQRFAAAIQSMNPETRDREGAVPACLAIPHHRIEYYAQGRLVDTMEVCFECGKVVTWKDADETLPDSLYETLHDFIQSIGLHPRRDWHELAKER